MASVRDRRFKLYAILYQALLLGSITLAIFLVGGTIYKFLFVKNSPNANKLEISENNKQGQTFTGIGRMRIPTADKEPGMVILFVMFPYYPDDKVFSEELVLRIRDFRHIITDYIGSFLARELKNQDEEIIKAEILHRLNKILRLGQIKTLYFSDFMIIE
jgi:flagellar FliL protein